MDSFFHFLERLGFNTTRMRWRWMRWKQNWTQRKQSAQRAKSHTTYQHKFCNQCGSLMDHAELACPRCGVKAPSWSGQVLERFFGLIMPSWGIFSALIIFACLADLQVGIINYGISHLFSPTPQSLVKMGALIPPYFYSGEYWRLITYGYLHIGIMHILFNLIALFQVGPFLEKEVGSSRFFSVYTLSLIGGGVADLILRGNSMFIVAGASGAVFGLIGFGITYNHFLGGPTAMARRNFFFHWAIYGFIFGYIVKADNYAHLGGLITGAVLGFLVEREGMLSKRFTPVWKVVAGICLFVTLFSFAGLILNIKL